MLSTPSKPQRLLRILHLSDTHNCHRHIEQKFGRLPPADIVVITGDMTNHGDDRSFAEYNRWLGEIKGRCGYMHIFLVLGNHDWQATNDLVSKGCLEAAEALDPRYMQQKLPHATILNHELVTIDGLTIFGSPFSPWLSCSNPDRVGDSRMRKGWIGAGNHRYKEIPFGTHIVLTHVPAGGIFDCTGKRGRWGSSWDLKRELIRKQCCAHMFGHLHEQRGCWLRSSRKEEFSGGCEFMAHGKPFYTERPHANDSPCLLISCNAMISHPHKDGLKLHMAGCARLVIAEPSDTPEGIRFRVAEHGTTEYSCMNESERQIASQLRQPEAHGIRQAAHELAHRLARHFEISQNVVQDILLGLQREQADLSIDDLEEQATVMLSGMCDSSDSEDCNDCHIVINAGQ